MSATGDTALRTSVHPAMHTIDWHNLWVKVRFAGHEALESNGNIAIRGGRRVAVVEGRLGANPAAWTSLVLPEPYWEKCKIIKGP